MSAVDSFWARVAKTDTCWLWTGSTWNGYGRMKAERTVLVHRFSYELHHGPIPAGMHVDHICRNRACVNPAHLEAVTQAENNRRAAAFRTHCAHGHALDENSYPHPTRGRICRVCKNERKRAGRAQRAGRAA